MKKTLIFLLIALTLLCLSACNEANANGETNNKTDGQESTEGTTSETEDFEIYVPDLEASKFHGSVTWTDTITKEPTCEAEGEKTYACFCGETHKVSIPALGHDTVIDEAIPPTCTQDGKTEGSHCSRCNEVFVEQEVIPALGGEHVIVMDEAVEPTCSKTGLSEGKHCSRCGKIYVRQAEIPKKAHVMGDLIIDKEPTCTEDGKRHKACENCDYREEYIIPASHKYTVTEKDSTKTFSCNMCDRVVKNVEDIIILLQRNEDGTYTVEVSGGYGAVDYVWIAWTSMPTVNEGGAYHTSTPPFSFHVALPPILTYQSITIEATDELGQQSVYTFKLPTAELLSSEHRIVDKSTP